MYMDPHSFSFIGRVLNRVGLYTFLKLFEDRKHADLYKYSTSSFLIKHFGGIVGQEANHKSGYLGFGLLHYAFISVIKPERVLCVGSQRGFVPAICAMACKDVGKGRVDFVDAGKDTEELGSWGGVGFWKKNDIERHFSPFDLNRYIDTYVMNSADFARKYNRKYEYIYIDADHSYKGVKADFERFWPRLAAGGMMSFHDISLKGLSNGEEFGVWKFWEELKEMYKLPVFVHDNSVGFVQKVG